MALRKIHCLICGKPKLEYDSHIKRGQGKYCSYTCAAKAKQTGEKRNCVVCGIEFYATKAQIKRGNGTFCSRSCAMMGTNNPSWDSGISKQSRCCQKCGKQFFASAVQVRNGFGKYCSVQCANSMSRGTKHPLADKACSIVNEQIRQGRLKRVPCTVCGEPKTDAHHVDYSEPFNIMWLCRQCHAAWHKIARKEGFTLYPRKDLEP